MSQNNIITVDGPSGVGKGTISQLLAQHLGWHLLDSGALYRITALAAQRCGVDLQDEAAVSKVARELDVEFALREGEEGVSVLLIGDDVTADIRTAEAGNHASVVAAHAAVRDALLQRQRDFYRPPGLIADGRDMGTTVFPQARRKFFLTASADIRAERRYKQLKQKGLTANLPALVDEIRARDDRDRNRSASPLRPADDAIEIDTSHLTISAVLQRCIDAL